MRISNRSMLTGLQFVLLAPAIFVSVKLATNEASGSIANGPTSFWFAEFNSSSTDNLDQEENVNTRDWEAIVHDLEIAWGKVLSDVSHTRNTRLPVERFMGYVEGRLGVALPETWEQRIREAEYHHEDTIRFTSVRSPYVKASDDLDVTVSRSFRIERIDGKWHLLSDSHNIPLIGFDKKTNTLRVGESDIDCFLMAIGGIKDNNVIVAYCASAPFPYSLMRLADSGDVLWSSTVECQSPPLSSRPTGMMRGVSTEIVISNGCAIVFGFSRRGIYIESFDLTSGKNLYRFSSKVPQPKDR